MDRPRAGSADGSERRPKVTRAVAAEAAVWVTRLHGPERSPQMESDFRAWQAQSEMHREAFEKCTDVWIDVGRIKLSSAYETMAAQKSSRWAAGSSSPHRWIVGAAITGVVATCLVAGQRWWQAGLFDTDVGEQRVLTLDDGSRMRLNTDTQVRVSFDNRQRTVTVRHGEALFEVAKDVARPFVVRAAGSEVVAVGTAFSVRYGRDAAGTQGELAVTLIEGQVNVRPAVEGIEGALAPDKLITMKAGERLRLERAGSVAAVTSRMDHPNVEEVTAWQRSEAVFDATTLADAVAEMNRYSRTPIVLVDGLAQSNLRVSGLYRTGDNAGFANAVARLHGLRVSNEPGRLALAKAQ